MRISILASVASAVILVLTGCNSSKSPAPTSSGPAASSNSSQKPATAGTGQPDSAFQAGSGSTPHAASTPPGQPTKESTKTEKAAEPPHELIAGLTDPAIGRRFESTRKRAEENPTDWRAQLEYVHLLQTIGHARMNNSEPEKGYQTFELAGALARKFLETKAEIPAGAHNVLAAVFYNEACAAARRNDNKTAIASLDEAIKFGFDDFTQLEKDEDLVSVRAAADFTPKFESWKQAARERAMKHAKEDLAAGESFPFDFALTDVNGKAIKLADFRGKVVIVDIWGTWCPPCRAEIPSFVKLQQTFGENGFQMIGLNEENSAGPEAVQLVKTFMDEQGINYPCALIDEATKKQVPNLQGFPTTLFLDRTGKVRLKAVGLHEYVYLESIVLALFEEPASTAAPAASE